MTVSAHPVDPGFGIDSTATDVLAGVDLTGKVAVVTGGSRGLGREMVLAFAAQGADVVIASRKLDNCESVAAEVRALGRRALAVAYHAASWDGADQLADAAYAEFGHVDVLVNNAGMSPLYDSVAGVSEELYDKVMGVNLKGPFRLSANIGTRMAAADGGSIIFVSSIASRRPGANELVYAAAKAGVNTLTVGLARTFGPTVRVNCIVPGPFLTDISKAWDLETFNRSAKAGFALQRGGEPHEVVGAALYFASAASSYTTGALLDIDGGPR
jgi:NAD(P)-dependent dehydrogenase (short-subunit alcohol dehydrogenase family)